MREKKQKTRREGTKIMNERKETEDKKRGQKDNEREERDRRQLRREGTKIRNERKETEDNKRG